MKRPVSLVASLFVGLCSLTACDGAAGKTQLVEVCTQKMGSATKCGCFAENLEKALTPAQFTDLAASVKQSGELTSGHALEDKAVAASVLAATNACLQ